MRHLLLVQLAQRFIHQRAGHAAAAPFRLHADHFQRRFGLRARDEHASHVVAAVIHCLRHENRTAHAFFQPLAGVLHAAKFFQTQQKFFAPRAGAQIHVDGFRAHRAVIAPARGKILRHVQHKQLHAVVIVKPHPGEIFVALRIFNRAAGIQPRGQTAFFILDPLGSGAQSAEKRVAGHRMGVHRHLDIQRPVRQHLFDYAVFQAALPDFHARIVDDYKTVFPQSAANAAHGLINSHN